MMLKGLLISKPTVTIWAWFDQVRRHYSIKTVSTDQLFNVFDLICYILDQIKYYIEEQGKVVEGSPICGGS